jgi:hypothetical protein
MEMDDTCRAPAAIGVPGVSRARKLERNGIGLHACVAVMVYTRDNVALGGEIRPEPSQLQCGAARTVREQQTGQVLRGRYQGYVFLQPSRK